MPQVDIDTSIAAAHGRSQWTLQGNAGLAYRFNGGFWQGVGVFIHRSHTRKLPVPFDLYTGCFNNPCGGCDNGGANAVAGNEGDFMHAMDSLSLSQWILP